MSSLDMFEDDLDLKLPILKSRLKVPALNSNTIERNSILTKLDSNIDRCITLISAPAGYGKTTILTNWLYKYKDSLSWYSIDSGDNDINCFVTYLICSFHRINKNIGKDYLSLLNTPQAFNIETVLIGLLNDVGELEKDVYLVLDDYQFITLSQIHEILIFLANNLPDNLHLIISSRSDPPLPLAKLRSKNKLVEIRAKDLRFLKTETVEFFRDTLDLQEYPKVMDQLDSMTEGWITGLQLIKLSINSISDLTIVLEKAGGNNRHITDYLVEEAKRTGSLKIQNKIEAIGPPPYDVPDKEFKKARYIIRYGGFIHKNPLKGLGFVISKYLSSPEYSILEGINTIGGKGLKFTMNMRYEELKNIDLAREVPSISTPVYFLQGKYDMTTPTILIEDYYQQLRAEKGKELIIFENSAHAPTLEEKDAYQEFLIHRVLKDHPHHESKASLLLQ